MIDKFTIKEIISIVLILQIGGIVAIYACILHLKTCLKDHAQIYKAIMRISGDMPH